MIYPRHYSDDIIYYKNQRFNPEASNPETLMDKIKKEAAEPKTSGKTKKDVYPRSKVYSVITKAGHSSHLIHDPYFEAQPRYEAATILTGVLAAAGLLTLMLCATIYLMNKYSVTSDPNFPTRTMALISGIPTGVGGIGFVVVKSLEHFHDKKEMDVHEIKALTEKIQNFYTGVKEKLQKQTDLFDKLSKK